MNYTESAKQKTQYRRQIDELRVKLAAVQAAAEPQPIEDYNFATPAGPVRLSALFGRKHDLIAIHNMGAGCRYCTLWADGFNGLYPHLADRAAFVVTSPDAPEAQQKFAASRGWRFPMASHQGTSFAADMGYRSEIGGWLPGVSTFRRDGARLLRIADAPLHPGDDYCALWHLFDLLPGGVGEWEPKYSY